VIRASIDLGTNTCLLLLADWARSEPEPRRVLADLCTIVRLGQGVDRNRLLLPEAMERTLACLRQYAEEIAALGADPREAVCVATSQARDAANGAEFFARVENETGFRFKIISGDEEARLTFLGGLLPGMTSENTALIDIGGGSTELIAQSGNKISGKSIDIGSVRFTERFFQSDPVTDQEFWACQAGIDEKLAELLPWRERLPSNSRLLAVAGTATTLASAYLQLDHFDAGRIDQTVLTRGDIHRLVEELKWRKVVERAGLPGIEPGRADIILAGALILWRVLERLGFPEVRVSTRGLRYGALKGY